jgi:ferredoxin, 2Fe-2S
MIMAEITIKNLRNLKVKVNNNSASILKNAQENYIDWMHACGGKGKCTTCRAEILEGMEFLSEKNECELRMAPRMSTKERLACQAIAHGDIVLRIPKNCQFPHMTYEEVES